MRTQEEIDNEYMEQQRLRREAVAKQAEMNNKALSSPKEYRGLTYYRTQYNTFVAPGVLDGSFTKPYDLFVAIDKLLREKDAGE